MTPTTARVVLHHAAQLAAAPGATLATPQPDASHTALTWSPALGAFLGTDVNGTRAGLRLAEGELLVLSEGQEVTRRLNELTRDEALQWLGEHFGAPLQLPTHELPPHPIERGARYPAPDAQFATLAAWFQVAAEVFTRLVGSTEGASVLRCWPHHFDLATLVTRAPAPNLRTIGVGLSPGDGSYDEPYWYVTPWPYPAPAPRPQLPAGGVWHEQGWVGAVLRGTREVRPVETFLRAAFEACVELTK